MWNKWYIIDVLLNILVSTFMVLAIIVVIALAIIVCLGIWRGIKEEIEKEKKDD